MIVRVKNKGGVSAVVSSVLLILIIISAAGLLYAYISNTTSKITNLSPAPCIDLQSKSILDIRNTQYIDLTQDLALTISRSAFDNPIDTISFKLNYDGGNSEIFDCGTCGDCTVLEKGSQKVYLINTENKPSNIELFADGCSMGKKIIIS